METLQESQIKNLLVKYFWVEITKNLHSIPFELGKNGKIRSWESHRSNQKKWKQANG
jgi:hypothetical protein